MDENNLKIYALYLPAFHKDKINDKTWGENFTEWDNVKNGKILFKNHKQPLIPLNKNYYDLSDKDAIINQINLANKYKVDGFIFYHYWFGDNITALTKPVEILKDEIKEEIEYCFCWANHSWIKNWHGSKSGMIAEQKYNGEEEWKKHIEYLIPFFNDSRYIKINGRPMLYVYNMSDIPCFEQMIKCWNNILKENNINEIYIVEFISSKNKRVSYNKTDAVVEFEPLYTTYFDISKVMLFKRWICKKFNLLDFQNYNYLWKKILKRDRLYNREIQRGCFVGWDNSARKGYDSMIVKNSSSKKFGINLKKLVNSKRKDLNNIVVINAWNEWSEGAYLEPDEVDKYKYLEEIKKIKDQFGK